MRGVRAPIFATIWGFKLKSASPSWLLSSADLARLLNVTDRHVRRLATQGVLPRVGRKFDPFACVPAFLLYLERGGDGSADLAEARLKLVEAQRREIESRTRRAEKRVLPADEVAGCFESAMTLVGSQLDALGRRFAAELAALDVAQKITHGFTPQPDSSQKI